MVIVKKAESLECNNLPTKSENAAVGLVLYT